MESASMNETSPPTSTNKIKYIKKSDGKILEETVDSLLNEQSVTDWYDYDPASKDKLNWQDPEFGKAIDRAAAKDYKQPSPLELKFEPEEVEATPLPTQAFGSVSGIKDTLKDLGVDAAAPAAPAAPVDKLEPEAPEAVPIAPVKDFEKKVEDSLKDSELEKKIDDLKPERNIVETSEVKDAPEDYKHSYAFSKVGGDVPIEEYNSDTQFYGASMQKPILALMNLITQGEEKRLNEAELDQLISYHGNKKASGGNSNEINKRIAGYIDNEAASDWLKNLGLDNQLIRYGRSKNKQTAAGYTKFLSQLMNYKNHPYLSQYPAESEAVLNRIMANSSNAKEGIGSHEAKNFNQIKNMVNKELGYNAVDSMSGKGGRAFGARNFSFVIKPTDSNEQYIFTMYTQDPDKRGVGAPSQRYSRSHRIVAQKLAELIRKHGVGKK